MDEYKPLPDPSLILVHGELALMPGKYKSGNLNEENEGDQLIHRTALQERQCVKFYVRKGPHWVTHRDDGPAIVFGDGVQQWYYLGQVHRMDGPAMVNPNGTRIWSRFGLKHRDDGPAVERTDGTREWWTFGRLIKSSKEPDPRLGRKRHGV